MHRRVEGAEVGWEKGLIIITVTKIGEVRMDGRKIKVRQEKGTVRRDRDTGRGKG